MRGRRWCYQRSYCGATFRGSWRHASLPDQRRWMLLGWSASRPRSCSLTSPGSRRWRNGWRGADPAAPRSCRACSTPTLPRLMALIAEHGGEVISFAGDGLLAVWPATGEDEDLARRRAGAGRCALAVQAALHGYQTLDGLRLSLRIGVGAGEVMGLRVGGVGGRWQLLLSGAPLVQGGLAEQQAARGEVVLSPEAWELAQHGCTGQRLAGRRRAAEDRACLDGFAARVAPDPGTRRRRGAGCLCARSGPGAAGGWAGRVAGRAATRHAPVPQSAGRRPGRGRPTGASAAGHGGRPADPAALRRQPQAGGRRRQGPHADRGVRAAAPGPRGRPGPGHPGRARGAGGPGGAGVAVRDRAGHRPGVLRRGRQRRASRVRRHRRGDEPGGPADAGRAGGDPVRCGDLSGGPVAPAVPGPTGDLGQGQGSAGRRLPAGRASPHARQSADDARTHR